MNIQHWRYMQEQYKKLITYIFKDVSEGIVADTERSLT